MRIGILGANGKVGTELALFMHGHRREVEIVGLVRSAYSTVLLEMAGVPCEIVDFSRGSSLQPLLRDCDVVVDLTYPRGQTFELPRLLARNIEATMGAMRSGATYVHVSSVSAFGGPAASQRIRDYRVARTSYAQIKRDAERSTRDLARRHGVKPVIFRLGQTHGYLQSVTSDFLRALELGAHILGDPAEFTNTVFINSVADAVLKCARGELTIGETYTLISNPQWRLEQLVAACLEVSALRVNVSYAAPPQRSPVARLVSELRDVADAHLFMRLPRTAIRAKGLYRVRAARAEAALPPHVLPPKDVASLLGPTPGKLIPGLESSYESAIESYRAVAALLGRLLDRPAAAESYPATDAT